MTSTEQRPTVSRTSAPGYRTYEIYQRMRVDETTAKIKPRQLSAPEFLVDR